MNRTKDISSVVMSFMKYPLSCVFGIVCCGFQVFILTYANQPFSGEKPFVLFGHPAPTSPLLSSFNSNLFCEICKDLFQSRAGLGPFPTDVKTKKKILKKYLKRLSSCKNKNLVLSFAGSVRRGKVGFSFSQGWL